MEHPSYDIMQKNLSVNTIILSQISKSVTHFSRTLCAPSSRSLTAHVKEYKGAWLVEILNMPVDQPQNIAHEVHKSYSAIFSSCWEEPKYRVETMWGFFLEQTPCGGRLFSQASKPFPHSHLHHRQELQEVTLSHSKIIVGRSYIYISKKPCNGIAVSFPWVHVTP